MIAAKSCLQVTAHQHLRLPFNNYNHQPPNNCNPCWKNQSQQQLQPANSLKHPDFKIQPKKQTPTKNSIGKATTTTKEIYSLESLIETPFL
jgi:hypothetical protein